MQDCPIAIVGYSYRAPGVGRKGLWEFLAEAKSAWSTVPTERFDFDAYHWPDKDKPGCISSAGGHFLPDDPYAFDAPFFHLRTEEARGIEPTHRMLLECALEAAECAGITLGELAGSNTGVFSAMGTPEAGANEDLPMSSTWTCVGAAPCMYANRLSYFFDLKGPSIALDAACASSTYAIHMACQSLRTGECDSAFAGGSNLLLGPIQWSFLDTMGALSPEGKCFSYDEKASGFGRGEGGACLMLKRLDDAIKCNDPIQAVIRNTACNHSGRTDGITMPSRPAQESLLLRVHQEIGLSPYETPVVEGHGTGTKVGDPIEAAAFVSVLGGERTASDPLYIGSLKSNFGHLEGASGALAVVKAVMMLQQGCILPNANFEKLSENIADRDRICVAKTKTPWPKNSPRRICVTNFGFGGSNAIALLEETPISTLKQKNGISGTRETRLTNGTNGGTPHRVPNGNGSNNYAGYESVQRLYVFSAKSEPSLAAYISSFSEYLEVAPSSSNFMKDLSYTLGQRRTHHSHRVAAIADSLETLKKQLSVKPKKVKESNLTFVFTGQGAQYAQMAQGLKRYDPFKDAIELAEAQLKVLGAKWSLQEELCRPDSETRINDAELSQPACTAIQLALVLLLRYWGVEPTMVIGHSSGEIAAAFAARLISFETALAVAYFRGVAAAKLNGDAIMNGAMLALGTNAEDASNLLQENTGGYATIAAINSPQSVTISGDASSIDNIHRIANARGMFARKLKVGVAYHSQHMEKVAAFYRASIEPFCKPIDEPLANTSRPVFISSVFGARLDTQNMDSSYWVKNLLQPVRFSDAVQSVFTTQKDLVSAGGYRGKVVNVLLEIGPHSALQGPTKQVVDHLRSQQSELQLDQVTFLSSLVRGTASEDAMLALSKNLFCLGVPIKLGAVNQTNKLNAHVLSDLPAYAWDKSARYVLKTRIGQARLHPGQPYHPLLGWRNADTDPSEISFRQVFTLDEIPWIRDHNVGGQVIFPLTGYLSLAVEAARRTASTKPSNLLVREFHIKRSLEIEEDERVDITTKLRPLATGTETYSSTNFTFEIMTWSEEYGWTTHCHGQVEAGANDLTMDTPTFKASAPLVYSNELKERDAQLTYTEGHKDGTRFGPAFKSMINLWVAAGWTVMETQLRDMDLSQPSPSGSLISADAPTLDGFLQGSGPFLEDYGQLAAMMPNYISRLRISNDIPMQERLRLKVVTRLLDFDTKVGSLRASVAVFRENQGSLVPYLEMESVTFRIISAGASTDSGLNLPSSYFWDMIPSLDYLTDNAEMRNILEVPSAEASELDLAQVLNSVVIDYMDRALRETENDDRSQTPSHLASFRLWATREVERQRKTIENISVPDLMAKIAGSGGQAEMILAVCEQLPQILRGEIQALEVMLKDNRLAKYYEGDRANNRLSVVLARWVRQLADAKFNLRILEIGAGTGSATTPIFEELSRGGDKLPLSFSYTYTDISSGFFETAREKFGKWSKHITYKKLDIGKDPTEQGFTLEDYDLVVASNVLHATPNIKTTIRNVRSLLKPSGKLVLLEACRHAALTLPFALLPGWWLSEDEYRDLEEGPLLTLDSWNSVLLNEGFSGLDNVLEGYPGDPRNLLNVIISTRMGLPHHYNMESITICSPLRDEEDEEFAQSVSDLIAKQLNCQTTIKPFTEIIAEDDRYCVMIDNPRHSIFRDLQPADFEVLKDVLWNIPGLLWVIPENHHCDCDLVKGLLRTVRLENGGRNLLILENLPLTSAGASAITRICRRLQDPEQAKTQDLDYAWKGGMICLPRYRPLEEAREVFASEAGLTPRSVQKLWQNESAFEMTVSAAGSPDSIYFKRTDILEQPLGDEEILIKIEASGMNFRDVLLVLGSIPWTRPGFEGSGQVVKVGRTVTSLRPGDRVFFGTLHGGSFATHVKGPSWIATKLPSGMSITDSAGMSVAYSTAIMSLMKIGQLKKGESVLIHAASGAVGQACIVLSQYIGAEIYATAGTQIKREFLQKEFNIPADHIFSSRTSDFRDGILAVSQGKGVDVIVNSLAGSLLQDTWAVIGELGRFVEIGKRDILQNNYLPMGGFDRNATFTGVDLRKMFLGRPDLHKECSETLMDLVNSKVVQPIRPVTVLPVSQIATGIRKLQSGQNIGKIVITMGQDERVLGDNAPPKAASPSTLLRHDATYLITGGTGGIGLSLVPWMAEHGAGNIVLLGRSGSSRPEVKKMLERYEGTNVCVRAFACDVSRREELASALGSIKDLPPVGGVIHGALWLNDKLFGNASYDDWKNITSPRVRGSWNLHELLPDNLDFFVSLSSFIAGGGNEGQSIYSATASFYDSFAEYRSSLGQPTVAIALPVVLDVGYVADRNMEEKLGGTLGAVLSEEHLRTVIKGAIIGPSSRINRDSKAISFSFTQGEDNTTLPWQSFHPRALADYILAASRITSSGGLGGEKGESVTKRLGFTMESNPLLFLLEILMDKVSSITMIERDEIEPDAPLSTYSLDSLVSVELRNWIRRETGVELALNKIVNSGNLSGLAKYVLAQKQLTFTT